MIYYKTSFNRENLGCVRKRESIVRRSLDKQAFIICLVKGQHHASITYNVLF